HYGWIFAGCAAGLILSSQLNTVVLQRFSSDRILLVALPAQTAVGLLLVAGTAAGGLSLPLMVLLVGLFLSCQGFIFPNASALALAPFSKHAGSASALMGALQMGLGALASASVSIFNNQTAVPMTAVMAACTASGLLILMIGNRIIRYKASKEEVEEQSTDLIM
ncbi:MAG TPA: Bcr/CflA family drug resistance efflux transporter, partial [Sphingobacteriaceae bacterium]